LAALTLAEDQLEGIPESKIYKSSSSNPGTEKLPEIKKENFQDRLEEIRRNTPQSCSVHKGFDCEKGEDKLDGSVICNDGFKDSKESFFEFCSQTRLQLISERFLDADGADIPREHRMPKASGGIVPAKIIIRLRNLSGIKAKQVKVEGEIVKRKFRAEGPEEIDPYNFEEYTWTVEESRLPIFSDFRRKYQTLINCQNCLSSRRGL
jgi:hypothetical protein